MSETKNLAKALAAFQADLPSVTLDGTNPHFKSRFATLANMTHKILPALAEHGLAFTSAPMVTEHGNTVLEASLVHESGEKITASLPLPGGKPQDVGSALTYYRRYMLAALTGVVADDDDDGNTAQAKSVAPPAEWRKIVAESKTVDELTAIYQKATGEGWATQDVMQALTARRKQVEGDSGSAAA